MKFRFSPLAYLLCDILSTAAAAALALALRYDPDAFPYYSFPLIARCCLLSALVLTAAGFLQQAYNTFWIYIGFAELFKQIRIALIHAAFMLTAGMLLVPELRIPDMILYCGFLFLLTTAARSVPRCLRWLRASRESSTGRAHRAIVIGAGEAASMLIKHLRGNPSAGICPVAVLDDDPRKRGVLLSGVNVCGKIRDVRETALKCHADEIIIAIPSASPEQLDRIYGHCLDAAIPVKIIQTDVDCHSFLRGNRSALSDVPLEDLLSREAVRPDMSAVYGYLRGKTVLVTGGAGSIGSELCRQILWSGCRMLLILDIHENGLFALDEELKASYGQDRYRLCIGSVQDERRLAVLFEENPPDIVFHAAAHKHVPMMELNPSEAVKNNIFGTRNVIRTCIKFGTGRFVLISTDKAVRPTSMMGATKRAAEMLVQYYNGRSGCDMTVVRFGNVLGSNGSVVPTFRRQIAAGGPVTVTHIDICRYFMTIPEAVSLVLCAGVRAHGGEIFILDMGKQVRIYDLACRMIRMAGMEPHKDIRIVFTGLRPGEKLYEELSLDSENVSETGADKIFVVRESAPPADDLELTLERLQRSVVSGADSAETRSLVFDLITRTEAQPAKTGGGSAVAAV